MVYFWNGIMVSFWGNINSCPFGTAPDNHAILSIRKGSFVKGESWSFIYNGNKIGFVVKNTDLIKYTDEGARFAKGDHIRVKLEILQVYNKKYRSFVNKSYKIIEFYEHIKSPEQGIIAFTS